MQKGLTLRSGQTHVKRRLVTKLIQEQGRHDLADSHRSTRLEDEPELYKTFKAKKDGCTKVVFHPAG